MLQTVFEYVNISASNYLEVEVKEKLATLHERFPDLVRADIFFKKENRSDEEEEICEIRLSAPGPRIFAETNADNFISAISITIKNLEIQLLKRKEKLQNY